MRGSAGPAEEFAQALRRLRRVGLRTLVARQEEDPGAFEIVLSRTQLSRYETGQLLPPVRHARHLDRLYEADGWLEMRLQNLWRPDWDPWTESDLVPQTYHAVEWPWRYAGLVWIKLIPARVGESVRTIELQWGHWVFRRELELARDGLVLTTGKARDVDGISVICNIASEEPVFVLHGTGTDLSGEKVLDIRQMWSKRKQ